MLRAAKQCLRLARMLNAKNDAKGHLVQLLWCHSAATRDVVCSERLYALQIFLNLFLVTFCTHGKKNLTHWNSLLLYQICHVQSGEKMSSHLATGSEFQYIFCIPSSLRPSNHFVPFHVIFHLDGNYTEILHTESILKSQASFMT